MRLAMLGWDDQRAELAPIASSHVRPRIRPAAGFNLWMTPSASPMITRVDGRGDDRQLAPAVCSMLRARERHERPQDHDQPGAEQREALAGLEQHLALSRYVRKASVSGRRSPRARSRRPAAPPGPSLRIRPASPFSGRADSSPQLSASSASAVGTADPASAARDAARAAARDVEQVPEQRDAGDHGDQHRGRVGQPGRRSRHSRPAPSRITHTAVLRLAARSLPDSP